MPDQRQHRGAHPEDAELFAPAHWPALRTAIGELCWLLDRGYALRSSLALTGDRHGLTQRQRIAVARCACSREQHERRATHRVEPAALAGAELWIDGYNLLITLEAALAGGVILLGRDGCYRDMASLHGTYREVAETRRAATLVGETAARCGVVRCHWLLDRPVGNSGRLKTALLELAQPAGWNWTVELAFSPDQILGSTGEIVASSDSVVLDRCTRWCNLARELIARSAPAANVLDLSATLG
ncbi:DUF434 domain-containing protein [Opitutus terrae]|uniref:DUF434 domain-containing protein n=1 Tax=Opitutus terrae (strain DSM 11246 / JCM 15787 / PB90-1) TaxID=452637 RepID=B1ZRA9_OPITP|nr:DUF434 domain-containing protein [Opitutus terrae]ACB74596.1 conserved hypothetical protein [Opitutus terrae PB90-1]